MLVTDAEGRFGFRHALLREVITGDLLPGERSSMHLELARALEDAGPECMRRRRGRADRDDRLSLRGRRRPDSSAANDVRAAREAQRVHAYDEAAEPL